MNSKPFAALAALLLVAGGFILLALQEPQSPPLEAHGESASPISKDRELPRAELSALPELPSSRSQLPTTGRVHLGTDCLPVSSVRYSVIDANSEQVHKGRTLGGELTALSSLSWQELVVGSIGWEEESIHREGLPSEIWLEARAISKISGRVFSSTTGEAISNYTLQVEQGIEDTQIIDPGGAFRSTFEVTDDANFSVGGFHLSEGGIDSCRLTVLAEGYLPFSTAWLPLYAGQERSGVEIYLTEDHGQRVRIEGVVLSGTGEPVEHADCYLVPQDSLMGSAFHYHDGEPRLDMVLDQGAGTVLAAQTDANGEFEYETFNSEKYTLVVVAKGSPAVTQDLGYLEPSHEPRQEEVHLSLPGTLEVSVQYPPQEDPRRYQVDLRGQSFHTCTPTDPEPGIRKFKFAGIEPGMVQANLFAIVDPDHPRHRIRLEGRGVQIQETDQATELFDVLWETLNSEVTVSVPEWESVPPQGWIVIGYSPSTGQIRNKAASDQSGQAYFKIGQTENLDFLALGHKAHKDSAVALALPDHDGTTTQPRALIELKVADTSVELRLEPDSMGHHNHSITIHEWSDPEGGTTGPTNILQLLSRAGLRASDSLRIAGLPAGSFVAAKAHLISERWTLVEGVPIEVELREN